MVGSPSSSPKFKYVPLQGSRKLLLLGPMVFWLIAAMFFADGWREYQIGNHMKIINANADSFHKGSGRQMNSRYLRYRFQVTSDGPTYTSHDVTAGDSIGVHSSVWDEAKQSGRILVAYDETNPWNNRPAEEGDSVIMDAFAGVGFIAFGALIIWGMQHQPTHPAGEGRVGA